MLAITGRAGCPGDALLAGEVTELVEQLTAGWPPWAGTTAVIVGAVLLGLLVHAVLFLIARQAARRTESDGDEHVVRSLRAPTRVGLPLLALQLVRPALDLAGRTDELVRRGLAVGHIGTATWLAIRAVKAGAFVVLRRHRTDVADNLEARRVHTQLQVITRIVTVVLAVVGAAAALMVFPSIRQLGASLLASAGIAGLIVGLAAQKTIANFLAGLQIALTGPIHLDDVVVIDGEWGRIEEITSTYVVVRIWDERRLIVPFSRIIEQSFENWTRRSADILGTVFLHADYTVPAQAVRDEVERLAEASEHWDGRVAGLVVTEAGDRTVQLRALVSAADSSKAWNLRCEVREGLVEFLQREHADCLPRVRAAVEHGRGAGAAQDDGSSSGPAGG